MILEKLNDITQKKFLGKISVQKEDDIYTLRVYLHHAYTYQAPIVIIYQGDEESFLKYTEQELKDKKLQEVDYIKIIKINKQCMKDLMI